MTKTTIVSTSTIDSLIGGFRSHLLGRPLPAPVAVTFHPTQGEVMVQPEGGLDLPVKLSNVLLWAYTLSEVTAEWTHSRAGRLHVSVRGRTSGGVHIQVYSGGEFTECCGLVPLAVGESEGASLDELYTLANLLREAQHDREAA
jgi:hypothetical protein